jgi:hypothetical protein
VVIVLLDAFEERLRGRLRGERFEPARAGMVPIIGEVEDLLAPIVIHTAICDLAPAKWCATEQRRNGDALTLLRFGLATTLLRHYARFSRHSSEFRSRFYPESISEGESIRSATTPMTKNSDEQASGGSTGNKTGRGNGQGSAHRTNRPTKPARPRQPRKSGKSSSVGFRKAAEPAQHRANRSLILRLQGTITEAGHRSCAPKFIAFA